MYSSQSLCTCTARPVLPSDFTPFDRANQELQNAFLDESLAQKEAKLRSCKVVTLFTNNGMPREFQIFLPLSVGGIYTTPVEGIL